MLLNTYELEIKKSKFIAYYYEVKTKEEVLDLWSALKKEHKKAKHIPYAYILNNTAGKSDDKEPSGTSAAPIYNILERKSLTNKVIFIRAYSTCASKVIIPRQ